MLFANGQELRVGADDAPVRRDEVGPPIYA
jgi:hypothetical protein